MAGKKVFVSYDHSEDLRYKDLLRAWDASTSFDFEFDLRSPNVPIESLDAGRIKAALTTKMKEADYLLVIVGSKSHMSKWMSWEISRAKEYDVKLKIAVVKINRNYITPSNLYGTNAAFAYDFTFDNVVDVLSRATNNY